MGVAERQPGWLVGGGWGSDGGPVEGNVALERGSSAPALILTLYYCTVARE